MPHLSAQERATLLQSAKAPLFERHLESHYCRHCAAVATAERWAFRCCGHHTNWSCTHSAALEPLPSSASCPACRAFVVPQMVTKEAPAALSSSPRGEPGRSGENPKCLESCSGSDSTVPDMKNPALLQQAQLALPIRQLTLLEPLPRPTPRVCPGCGCGVHDHPDDLAPGVPFDGPGDYCTEECREFIQTLRLEGRG